MEMTGGQLLARQLQREGVKDMFVLPGVQLDWATDALFHDTPDIDIVVPRHEQATSYMADGYARSTGGIGVAMVVPGPGMLNTLAGLSTAYACNSRVLMISGQIPTAAIGRNLGMLHEIPRQSEILGALTKWHGIAKTPAEVPGLVNEAFRQLKSGRPRPVAIEVPPDVFQGRAEVALPDAAVGERATIDPQAIERAAALLSKAKRPLIYVGGGGVATDASGALAALAEKLQAPVAMSSNGYGALSAAHPLAVTALAGLVLLPHADVVLVAGSRFVRGLGAIPAGPDTKFIYLNAEPADTGAPRVAGEALVGDIADGLAALVDALGTLPDRASRAREAAALRAWVDGQLRALQPQYDLSHAIRSALPEDGVLVSEMTQLGYFANLGYSVWRPGTFITPGYQGTLGFGFATALGAAVGAGGRPVVSINGDGGFGWTLQELATAAKYNLDLTTVVFNDNCFGNVRLLQEANFKRSLGVTLHNPDYLKLGEAFGVTSMRVEGPADLKAALQASFARGGPTLIEVPVGRMPSPWPLLNPNAERLATAPDLTTLESADA